MKDELERTRKVIESRGEMVVEPEEGHNVHVDYIRTQVPGDDTPNLLVADPRAKTADIQAAIQEQDLHAVIAALTDQLNKMGRDVNRAFVAEAENRLTDFTNLRGRLMAVERRLFALEDKK